MSTVQSPFQVGLLRRNFPAVLIVFRQFFAWIALGDEDLCFSLILVREANAVHVETTRGT